MFGKVISMLVLSMTSFVLMLCIMMFGWGVEPQSWGWIIGGFVGQVLCHLAVESIGKT